VRAKHKGIFACLFYGGRTLALEPARRSYLRHELGHFTLAGTMVAFVDFQHGIDAGCAVIKTIDVARSRVVLFIPKVGCSIDAGIIKSESVSDLVVNEHGTVAWTVIERGFGHPSETIEVHSRSIPGSTTLLDSGSGIAPGSLRLAPGGEVSWLDRGRALYANLD